MLATDSFKAEIIQKYIAPSFRYDVEANIRNRKTNSIISQRLELVARICSGLAGLASSAAIAWQEHGISMNYIAIVLSTSSVVLHSIAVVLNKKAHTSNKQLNDALASIGIANVNPDTRPSSEMKEDM